MSDTALCRHFGICGGCAFQDMTDDAYCAMKKANVLEALRRFGLGDAPVEDVVQIGAGTRRRASFKIEKRDSLVLFGFHAANTHDIVDMQECRILTPSLFALVPKLRNMMEALLADGEKAELSVTETLSGPDLAIAWKRRPGAAISSPAANWATRLKLARMSANGDLLVELARPEVRFGKAVVNLPPDAFLQATTAGEVALQRAACEFLRGAKAVADLFSGCGTFALALAQSSHVHAVERDASALAALVDGARRTAGLKPVTAERRDLFKLPLSAVELERFDGILLDPPRAGALAQTREIARSAVPRVVYVSCNPSSFARDARTLVDGGYRLGTVTPIDQFLWSSHIELVATFARE